MIKTKQAKTQGILMDQISTSKHLTKQQAFALVDAVAIREDLAITASAYEKENDIWIFEATCEQEPDIEQFNQLVNEVLEGKVNFTIEPIDTDIDYVARSLEGLKPVSAGGFYIYGSHNVGDIDGNLIAIKIEAAQAFGTGHHETTTGCLEAIKIVLDHSNPQNILDVGTGTGVLAIALAKKTGVFVFASDIDPLAVEIAQENAKINEIEDNIYCFEAAGLDHYTIKNDAPYDLIVANILAQPLIEIAPQMSKIASSDARIILSGILEEQADKVIAAYSSAGFILEKRLIKNEWATLILSKQDQKI